LFEKLDVDGSGTLDSAMDMTVGHGIAIEWFMCYIYPTEVEN